MLPSSKRLNLESLLLGFQKEQGLIRSQLPLAPLGSYPSVCIFGKKPHADQATAVYGSIDWTGLLMTENISRVSSRFPPFPLLVDSCWIGDLLPPFP